MLILNEQAYCEAILSGDFTNYGIHIAAQRRKGSNSIYQGAASAKYYFPIITACYAPGQDNEDLCRRYAQAIDDCGLTNFHGADFLALYEQWEKDGRLEKIQNREGEWRFWTMLSGQTVYLDQVELDCLFTIKSMWARRKNLIALFLIKYLSLKYKHVKISYKLIEQLCGLKSRDTYDKYTSMQMEMGIMPIKGDKGQGNSWIYDRELMEEYYERNISPKLRSAPMRFPMRYVGDYIWHSDKYPLVHNGPEMINAFEFLRKKKIEETNILLYGTAKPTSAQKRKISEKGGLA